MWFRSDAPSRTYHSHRRCSRSCLLTQMHDLDPRCPRDIRRPYSLASTSHADTVQSSLHDWTSIKIAKIDILSYRRPRLRSTARVGKSTRYTLLSSLSQQSLLKGEEVRISTPEMVLSKLAAALYRGYTFSYGHPGPVVDVHPCSRQLQQNALLELCSSVRPSWYYIRRTAGG